MSTNKNKTALLAKLKRQKAKKKKKVYTMPKIKMSAMDKRRKAEKSFIPTSKTLMKKAKYEDGMRQFLTSVNNLGDDDFTFEIDNDMFHYSNKIVHNAYQTYIRAEIDEAILLDEDANREELQVESKKAWNSRTIGDKMKWAIFAYCNDPKAEWGRKKFCSDIHFNIRTEKHLRQFIEDYIASNITYDKFIESWLQNKGRDIAAFVADEVENEDVFGLDSEKQALTLIPCNPFRSTSCC